MPRGSKRLYTDKQKRRAEHIAESYEKKGDSEKTAKARAWRVVNAESHGGELKGGSGYGKPETHQASRRGGQKSMAGRTRTQRSQAAKKAAATRKRRAATLHRKRSVAAKRAAKKRAPSSRTSRTSRGSRSKKR